MSGTYEDAIKRLSFEPELERAFRTEFLQKHIGHLRALVLVTIVIALVMGLPMPIIPPETQQRGMLVAFGAIIPSALIILALSYLPAFPRFMQLASAIQGLIIGAGIHWFWSQERPEVYLAYGLAGTMVVIYGIYTLLRLRFIYAVATAGLLTAYALSVQYGLKDLPELHHMRQNISLILANVFGMLACYFAEVHMRREFILLRELEAERAKSETLLENVLPVSIAARLKDNPVAIADDHAEATVLFADIVDFTRFSAGRGATEVVAYLDNIFTRFDALADEYGLEKIKTVGDAYMLVGGVPQHRDDHVSAVASCALAMLAEMEGSPLALRIGIHTGPVVAGVIGRKRFLYDLWGDTVNTASRMESHGLASHIQVSEAVASHLSGFVLEPRGVVEVKGKGEMMTYLLKGRSPSEAGLDKFEELDQLV